MALSSTRSGPIRPVLSCFDRAIAALADSIVTRAVEQTVRLCSTSHNPSRFRSLSSLMSAPPMGVRCAPFDQVYEPRNIPARTATRRARFPAYTSVPAHTSGGHLRRTPPSERLNARECPASVRLPRSESTCLDHRWRQLSWAGRSSENRFKATGSREIDTACDGKAPARAQNVCGADDLEPATSIRSRWSLTSDLRRRPV